MGAYLPHGTGPGGVPIPGGAATDRLDSAAESGRKMGEYLSGGGQIGGGFRSNGNLHLVKVEYVCTVHFDMNNSRPM